MMRQSYRFCTALLILTLLAGTTGCTVLAVGAGGAAGVAYLSGEQEKYYPYPLEHTWIAVREVVDEMNLTVVEEAADSLSARLEGRLATGEKLKIELEPKAPNLTEVEIRVGIFGDSTASWIFFRKVDERLPGALAPVPPKPEVHVGVSIGR